MGVAARAQGANANPGVFPVRSLGRHIELVRELEREREPRRAVARASTGAVVLGLGLGLALLVLTAWVDSTVRDRYGEAR